MHLKLQVYVTLGSQISDNNTVPSRGVWECLSSDRATLIGLRGASAGHGLSGGPPPQLHFRIAAVTPPCTRAAPQATEAESLEAGPAIDAGRGGGRLTTDTSVSSSLRSAEKGHRRIPSEERTDPKLSPHLKRMQGVRVHGFIYSS